MNLKELLYTVMEQYPIESRKNYANNDLAKTIRSGLDNSVGEDFLPTKMKFKGSAGTSKWATIPWMGIFDRDISNGPSSGVGVVYLFTSDGNHVYLSLDQSWTLYHKKYKKDAYQKIKQVSKLIQSELTSITTRMNTDTIMLTEYRKSTGLPQGYELGNIVSIKYDKNNLPNNNVLLDDLRQMIKVFEELKAKLSKISDSYDTDVFLD
ncbi:MrcB family domain-containing protein [Companilactobacillus sp. HBUAS59699]|uniref:MrcB family domain-containing protein n=1 Tax=Companilactobacillus sp. HBUAS59699 TaxID=3109358 RepID=UPI002FF0C553